MRSRNRQPTQYQGEREQHGSEDMRGGYGSEYGRQRGGYPEHEEEQYRQQRQAGGFHEGHGQGGGLHGRPGPQDYGDHQGFRGQEGQRHGGRFGPDVEGRDRESGRGSYDNWGQPRYGRGWTPQDEYDELRDEPRFGQEGGLRRGFGRGDFGPDSQWASDDASRSTYGGRTSNSAASQSRSGMSRGYGGDMGGGTPGGYGGDVGGGMGGAYSSAGLDSGYSSGEMGGRFGSSDMSRGFGGTPTGGGYAGGQMRGGYAGGQLGGGYAGQDLERGRKGPRGYRRSDERIREFICERLAQHHELDVEDVSVEVRDGRVTLEGTVPERRMKHMIEDAADNTWGVEDVENHIRVASRGVRGQEDLSSGQLASGGTTGGGSTGLSGTTGSTSGLGATGLAGTTAETTARNAGGPGSSSQGGTGTATSTTAPQSGRPSGRDKE